MADLNEVDSRVLLGEDYKRRLNETALSDTATPEERVASRSKRAQGMKDLQFSFAALSFTGLALLAGALYANVGATSIQGLGGIAVAMVGFVGIMAASRKARSISAEKIGGL
jgi:hypothetical protein